MADSTFHIIAYIHSDFPTKFGIPRQSGLVEELTATVVFEPEYRNADALRGIEEFSHIWLIWGFSEAERDSWSPTVRPPRLGGNIRMGVFATRSPFRPNAIGLSSVKLLAVEQDSRYGTVLRVAGADLMDGTPIYDIKPYLLTTDCHPEATKGFTALHTDYTVEVEIPDKEAAKMPKDKLNALRSVLAQDPRPAYHHDKNRVYGFPFAGYEVSFTANENKITVLEISLCTSCLD
ncbi:MAG: tRNA (N6-threonylcarbamoyladenosine(37)-N6)-methyltransferase TrmO [Bacteroidales bacterium]|nr:tRNA (N6-threonylcarbamoyladenosine(37)-N6)-methyltransferase TrmO [Bacteroidales bacterium]